MATKKKQQSTTARSITQEDVNLVKSEINFKRAVFFSQQINGTVGGATYFQYVVPADKTVLIDMTKLISGNMPRMTAGEEVALRVYSDSGAKIFDFDIINYDIWQFQPLIRVLPRWIISFYVKSLSGFNVEPCVTGIEDLTDKIYN